nr:DUF2752 domain-containing protein [Lysinibacillus timonensis]
MDKHILLKNIKTNLKHIDWKKNTIVMFVLFILALIYIKILLPVYHIRIPCLFTEITGLQDPGEGLTSSLYALSNFEFYQAFRFNMLVFILPVLYILYKFFELAELKKAAKYLMGFMLFLTIVFGILRNIPYFEWLKPTII